MNLNLDILNKFINKNKIILFLLCIIILNMLIVLNFYNKDLNNNDIFRLHIIANTNSIQDQITKLKINSILQPYISNIIKDCSNTKEIYYKLNAHANDIINLTNQTLLQENKKYTSSINLGIINYDKKENEILNFKKGNYNSIKLILGKGEGKNIWSLIMPNKQNIEKINCYNTIIPNISRIFNENSKNTKCEYKSILFN